MKLAGAFVVKPTRLEDDRGYFARTWCAREFRAQGLESSIKQCSTSYSIVEGTLRGMHYQAAPFGEVKIVRCTRGAVYDVVADIRADSPTFRQWTATVLSAENGLILYIPIGFAHGFQTLRDRTEVSYQMSEYYLGDNATGFRWDDPAFEIEWPAPISSMSERDASFEPFPL
jgi:dTDP-4-dehydrorhamnose 3,5-epimerase